MPTVVTLLALHLPHHHVLVRMSFPDESFRDEVKDLPLSLWYFPPMKEKINAVRPGGECKHMLTII